MALTAGRGPDTSAGVTEGFKDLCPRPLCLVKVPVGQCGGWVLAEQGLRRGHHPSGWLLPSSRNGDKGKSGCKMKKDLMASAVRRLGREALDVKEHWHLRNHVDDFGWAVATGTGAGREGGWGVQLGICI